MTQLVDDRSLFEQYAGQIAALPQHTPLKRSDLLTPEFLLRREGAVELYYAPFDYVNEAARVVLVGITPGWYQTEQAFRKARDMLLAGATNE